MKSLFVALFLFSSLPIKAQDLTISGTMHHSTLEGGCWYLQGDGGKRYELVGDTAIVHPLRVDGQHVVVRASYAKGAASICMMGEIVRVIERIDTTRMAIDLVITPMIVEGKVFRSKSGVWYVKTPSGRRYEFEKSPAKKYRHAGATIHRKFRVLLDKNSTREKMNGLILSDSVKPPPKGIMLRKTYDAR